MALGEVDMSPHLDFKIKVKQIAHSTVHFSNFNIQECLTPSEFFLFWVPINPYKDWKVKLERAHFSKVQLIEELVILKSCSIKYKIQFY